MKKYIVFTFALIFLALLITACGKKQIQMLMPQILKAAFRK